MGVIGLWRLLDPTGKPVPLETLEGKVLAIDVSIWIHQVLQGYQDGKGNPMPNAHLLGLFNRICKLLFYKIKPVFVFDGGVPLLKKNTIAARRKQKSVVANKAQKMKNDLINNLIKHTVVKSALAQDGSAAGSESSQMKANFVTKEDIFKLPDMPSTSTAEKAYSDDDYDSDSSMEPSPKKLSKWSGNIHNVDVTSNEFKSLPADMRYDILTDLKETRKQNSWGRLHEMPEESGDFSGFQMKRLLKRRLVQESLESAEQEMGGKTLTMEELDQLLTEQGILTTKRANAFRIASDSTSRVIYISDTKALKPASSNNSTNELSSSESTGTKKDLNPDSRTLSPIIDNMNEYDFDDDWDSDIESVRSDSTIVTLKSVANNDDNFGMYDDWDAETELNESHCLSKKYFGKINKNPALAFMLEYSGLPQDQIVNLIKQNKKDSLKDKGKKSKSSKSKNSKLEKRKKSHEKSGVSHSIVSDSSKNNDLSSLTETKLDQVTKLAENAEEKSGFADDAFERLIKMNDVEMSSDRNSGSKGEKNETDNELSECVVIDTTSESDDFVEVTTPTKAINIPNTAINKDESDAHVTEKGEGNDDIANATLCVETDSGSDDFVEVQDVPIPEYSAPKPGLQITIKSDMKVEDDFFADIFLKEKPKSASNDTPLTSIEPKIQVVDSNLKKLEVILEESIVKDNEDVKLIEDKENSPHIKDTPNVDSCVEDNHPKEGNKTDTENLNKAVNYENAKALVLDDDGEFDFPLAQAETSSEQSRPAILPADKEELKALKEQLEDKQKELEGNIGKMERQATVVTDQIRLEAQELLQLFGIPYIVAPMEAEAQCAYLEEINLTDGTITDDSDIWLFGGRCVYKNFFNNNKRVLQFRSCDIQHHFKLTRHQLIQLALLVGSDYTTGLSGIGPVTALEVLATFPAEGENLLRGLVSFSAWVKSGRPPGPGRTSLRNKLRNVQIEKGFPSQAVVQAYLFPTIDESRESFAWGKPNVIHLADYVKRKFGWSKHKFEQIIGPVITRQSECKSQKGIDAYFKVKTVPKSIEPSLSKRVQRAVERMGEEPRASDEGGLEEKAKVKPKRRARKGEAADDQVAMIEVNNDTCIFTAAESPLPAKHVEEYIPQREKDRSNALKKKMHAIEIFRKSRKGLSKTKKVQRSARKITKEADLSESSSSS